MSSQDRPEVVNPLRPEIAARLDPTFLEIYNKYQGKLHEDIFIDKSM
jgi:hypothetical protein